jgi:ATP:corrinoid adenosyltransferase
MEGIPPNNTSLGIPSEFAASPLSLLADLVTEMVEFKHYYQKVLSHETGLNAEENE